MIEYRHK